MELKKYLDIENDIYINLVTDFGYYRRFKEPILEQIKKEYIDGGDQSLQPDHQSEFLRRIKRELINRWNAYPYGAKFKDSPWKPSKVELLKTGGNWTFILFETQEDKMEFVLTWS